MFCEKCGKEIPEDSTFCEFCGSPVNQDEGELGISYSSDNVNNRKQKNKIIIIVIIVVAIALVGLIIFFIVHGFSNGNEEEATEQTFQSETTENVDEYNNDDGYEENTYSNYESADYILPTSSDEIIDYSEISVLSNKELMLARNEIYARHGRIFTDSDVKNYFESKEWYTGTINPEDFSESLLNSCEKENIQRLSEEESERGIEY